MDRDQESETPGRNDAPPRKDLALRAGDTRVHRYGKPLTEILLKPEMEAARVAA